ncbi:MAG: aminoglycoside phosphotransferase family protein [Roseiflexaceae bacterium]
MTLSTEQLAAIVARALPGERLAEWQPLAGARYALALAGGERLQLHLFDSPDSAAAAVAALRLLRGEVDLPVPQLRAADAAGETTGRPYALTAPLAGEPLAALLDRLPEQALYDLGRRLGEVAARIHRLAAGTFGALVPEAGPRASDEHAFVLARLEQDLARCEGLGLLNRQSAEALRGWFANSFQPVERPAALLHGAISPDTVLVRQAEGGWRLGGLVGWEQALGWCPAWEHTAFLEHAAAPRLFGLRVGYGNGYDEQTQRAYEQLREPMMAPYRLLLALRRAAQAHERGDFAASERARNGALGLLRMLAGEP